MILGPIIRLIRKILGLILSLFLIVCLYAVVKGLMNPETVGLGPGLIPTLQRFLWQVWDRLVNLLNSGLNRLLDALGGLWRAIHQSFFPNA